MRESEFHAMAALLERCVAVLPQPWKRSLLLSASRAVTAGLRQPARISEEESFAA